MKSTFNWNPEQTLLGKLINLASKRGQSPESIISEAVRSYLLCRFRSKNLSFPQSHHICATLVKFTNLAHPGIRVFLQQKYAWVEV